LPTPKQEQLAYNLAQKNKFFKIICIGGSIAIASGEEKPVPKFLQDYEFLWRLKSDFFRRLIRLFESFIFYIKGRYINNLYNKTIFKIIEKK
jgi:UDP-N-acetyl-D-mannosaminuronic acid transferase (WecB/TagA/CpsF family)